MILSDLSSRRRFLGHSAVLALAPMADRLAVAQDAASRKYEFCTFTKPLQHLSYAETAQKLAAMGFDGVEAPIRPGGQVEPERVEDDLPKLVEALKKEGLALTVMTSGINAVSEEQRTEAVLRTAAGLGVKRFRMSYCKYDLKQPIRPQLAEFRAKLDELVALCREIGIKPIYQNHSGRDYFGAPLWDLAEALEPHSPDHVGIAYDIGHATVEGAKAWPLNFALLRPWLDTVYVKEPFWQDNRLGWGPLGEGAVDKAFYKLLKDDGFDGPVSLHVEYLDHKDPSSVPGILAAIERDFATLRAYLA